MTEGQEIPKLKAEDKLHARETAQRALLNITSPDRPDVRSLRDKLLVQRWQEVLPSLEGDGRTLAPQLRHQIEKFGVPKGDGTRKPRDGETLASYTQAEGALAILLPLLESADYDQMKDHERTAIRNRLRQALENSSQFPQYTSSMPDADKKAEEILRNLKLKEQLIEDLKPVLAMPLTSDEELLEAEKATKVGKAEVTEATERKKYTADDLKDAKDKLTNLINNPTTADQGIHARLLLDQINNYTGQLTNLQMERTGLEDQLGTTDSTTFIQLPNRNTLTERQNPQYLMLQQRLDANSKKQEALYEMINSLHLGRIDRVPSEETLEERRNAMRQEASSAKKEKIEAEFDEKGALVRYKELLEKRKLEEQAISIALERAFPRSLEVFAAKEIEHGTQLAAEKILEDKEDAIEKIKEDYMHHIETRWRKPETRRKGLLRRKVEDQVLDKQLLKDDVKKLLAKDGGVHPMMESVLTGMPEWATLNEDEQKALLGDEALQQALVKPLLANHILVNQLQPGELHQIMNMEHVKHSIDDALKTNEEYRTTVQKLMPVTGTGDLDFESSEFKDLFAKTALEHPGLLFFPLTTIPWAIVALIKSLWASNTQDERQRFANQIAA